MANIEALFEHLWQDYTQRLCPSAIKVHKLLSQKGEKLSNDHIALRTFSGGKLGLVQLAKHFQALGYEQAGEYHFEAKKLYAHHYQHPDPRYPKVFISELCLPKCSENLNHIIDSLIHDLPQQYTDSSQFLYQGRPWRITKEQYQMLAEESEYAAWVAAHGFGANHFTVSVNELAGFMDLKQVNDFLVWHNFDMNNSGGDVKGSEEVGLQQSSTLADKISVECSDGEIVIPGGFYEFAKRFPLGNGVLYQGFVTASADKIFESTNI
ncbi:DUF1338 domain-containing protein [Vibrio casei]|uniref:2-oxoadipate dioxygenase/decarboxylase n=1 Tax=Vibrio casei TaxID=673372 RepID=A0A368LKD5_9VIBR|nr:DUF1338 domain-containing protein [Vibrio casei]RCS72360.1 DUF1338 domain-containing protein [Vibrio casei]SJN29508.1 hypothetical protein FM109_09040 [Vibrio casei]